MSALGAAFRSLIERGDAFAGVAVAIVGLFLLVGLSSLGLFVHHTRSHLRRQTLRRRMAAATGVLAPTVNKPDTLPAAVAEAVRKAGPRAAAAVMREFRLRITGDFSRQLSRHLEDLGEVDRLAQLAEARRPWLRRAATRGLAECGGEKARLYLVQLLSDRDPEVRRTARAGLLSREDPQGIPAAIRSYLEDSVTHRGYKAAFYARLAVVAPEHLRKLLASDQLKGLEEKLALEALGDVQLPSEIPQIATLVAKYLKAEDGELRASAVRVLGKHRCDAFRPEMLAGLRDTVWFVRAAAARALEVMGADGAVDEALGAALTDREWWVRANAARALSRRGEAGLQRLARTLDTKDTYARDAALSALSAAGALGQLATRLRALADANPDDAVLGGLLRRAETAHA